MLTKETISKLAALAKIKVEDIENAIKDEKEIALEIPKLTVLTDEELTQRDENIGRIKYNEGKTAGVEMGVKEIKNEMGFEFEGKDIKSLVNAVKEKTIADAKIEPNKKVDELKTVIENLQNTLKTKDEEKLQLQNQLQSTTLKTKILTMLPANRLNTLSDDEYLTLINANYEIVEEDGKFVAKKDGQIVRDAATQNPLEPKSVIESFFNEKKFVGEPARAGREGGNSGGNAGVFNKLSELVKDFESKSKSVNGEEFQLAVSKAREANPQFDLTA